MSNSTMIPGRLQLDDCRFLHSQNQEARKNSLDRAALIIDFLETERSIIDGIPYTRRQSHELIASLLLEKLGMSDEAEKILSLVLFSPCVLFDAFRDWPGRGQYLF